MFDRNSVTNQPLGDTSGISLPGQNAPAVADDQTHQPYQLPTSDAAPAQDTPVAPGSVDLSAIKQQALSQLSPIVSHLDQTPEEKFRTTMMMIQASDDQSLIPKAYEAANAITDEKAKAQALLDVINEINYFSQRQG